MKIIITCGSKKADKPCMAIAMYQGGYYKNMLDWAKTICDRKDLYILSAKYGLIHCSKIIAPYNNRMNTPTQLITPEQLKQQIEVLGIKDEFLLCCGGKDYVEIMQKVSDKVLSLWKYANLKQSGMGYQRQWFKQNKYKLPVDIDRIRNSNESN